MNHRRSHTHNHNTLQDEQRLPDFSEGERFPFASLTLKDGLTSPPG